MYFYFNREEIKERAERAKMDLIQKARQAAAKEMDIFQGKATFSVHTNIVS
jgi:uncharacterized protein YbcI